MYAKILLANNYYCPVRILTVYFYKAFLKFLLISASVSSPIVAGGLRNLHDNKVSGSLSGNSANHHADNPRHGSSDDYLHMVHRLSSDVCNILVIIKVIK